MTSNITIPANNNTSLYNANGNVQTTTVPVANTSGVGTTIPSNNNTGLYNVAGQTPIEIDTNISVVGNISAGGYISAAGNVYGDYLIGNGAFITGISANSIIGGYSNANVVAFLGSGNSVEILTEVVE